MSTGSIDLRRNVPVRAPALLGLIDAGEGFARKKCRSRSGVAARRRADARSSTSLISLVKPKRGRVSRGRVAEQSNEGRVRFDALSHIHLSPSERKSGAKRQRSQCVRYLQFGTSDGSRMFATALLGGLTARHSSGIADDSCSLVYAIIRVHVVPSRRASI